MKKLIAFMLVFVVAAANCVPALGFQKPSLSKLERKQAEPKTQAQTDDVPVNADGLTPFEIYKGIMDAVAAMESYVTVIDMDLTVEIAGVSMSMSVEAEQGYLATDAGFDYYLLSTTAGMGVEDKTNMWYRDGMVYIESAGDKVKTAMNEEDFITRFSIPEPHQRLFTYEDAVTKQAFDEEEGKTVLCFTVDAQKSLEISAGDASSFMPMDIGDLDLSALDDIEMRAVLDAEGWMERLDLFYDFNYAESGVEAEATVVLTTAIYEPEEGSVEFPDFSEFHY
jgi:hypothetical protein